MAPVIWGLDLSEMQWAKFKPSYMWNTHYHLRRSKFVVYQLAMILCVISESIGTDTLTKYNKEQKKIEASSGGSKSVRNNDIIGELAFNIFTGVYVAIVFGSAFFFDLFWPERRESQSVRIAWRASAVFAVMLTAASAIVLTVLISTRKAILAGDGNTPQTVLSPALTYKHNGEAIASLVFLWLGFIATCASTVAMFLSIHHIERYGPYSAHVRTYLQDLKDLPPYSETDTLSQNSAAAKGSEELGDSIRRDFAVAQEPNPARTEVTV